MFRVKTENVFFDASIRGEGFLAIWAVEGPGSEMDFLMLDFMRKLGEHNATYFARVASRSRPPFHLAIRLLPTVATGHWLHWLFIPSTRTVKVHQRLKRPCRCDFILALSHSECSLRVESLNQRNPADTLSRLDSMVLCDMLLKAMLEHPSVAVWTQTVFLLCVLHDVNSQLEFAGVGLVAGSADVEEAVATPLFMLVEFTSGLEVSQ